PRYGGLLLPPYLRRLLPMAIQVNGVARFGLQRFGGHRIDGAQLGPDRAEPRKIQVGRGEKIGGGAAHPVAVERKPMSRGLVRAERQALAEGPRSGEPVDRKSVV